MKNHFEDIYRLRAADFDRWERLRPASVLDLFQDVAGRHAAILGVGTSDLIKKNIVWILVKVRLHILAQPKMYDALSVRTWPLPPDRIGYRREYLIRSEGGDVIAEGSSEWVLMDFTERKIVAGGDIYPLSEYCMDTAFPGRFPRIRGFEPEGESYSFTPPWSDFDLNGHVNNTKYANYVLDALSPDKEMQLRSLAIEYHREVLPGEKLNILSRREDGALLARGENSNGDKMFSCRLEFQN